MATRSELIARAFPDADVRAWRGRIVVHVVVAIVVTLAGLWPAGVLALLAGVPVMVRYLRQQLALGALMAEERKMAADAARLPLDDARTTRPLL